MHNDQSTYNAALRQLCEPLGLEYYSQDWAICVADPQRLSEFVSFYHDHSELDPLARVLLFELIIASISDALDSGADAALLTAQYGELVRGESRKFPIVLEYWLGLDSSNWQISAWMRDRLR